jgi:hypothetical protein
MQPLGPTQSPRTLRPAGRTPGPAGSFRGLMAVSLVALPSLAVALSSGGVRTVVAPLATIVAVTGLFYLVLFARSAVLPVDEIGTWYMAVLAAYTTIPLVVYLALGLQYTPLNDMRLYLAQPQPAEVARGGWYYAAYTAGFAVLYLAVRRQRPHLREMPKVPGASALTAGVGVAISLAISAAVAQIFDLNAENYADAYRVVQSLPLGVRQVLRLSIGLKLVFGLVLLTWAFADFQRRRWFVVAWFVAEAANTVIGGGARTNLMLLVISGTILYHRAVRPIRLRTAALGGALLLIGFLALGVLRAYRQLTDPTGFSAGVSGGEFETLFSNVLDLLGRRDGGELAVLHPALWGADFRAVVPSQLLPGPKMTYAEWYITTFYPAAAEAGHGYAFGAVAQSVIGFGAPEVLFRGALVGALFAAADRLYRRRTWALWPTVGYVWMTLWSYQSFRASTFYFLSMLVQQFLPAVVIVELGRAFLTRALSRRASALAVDGGRPDAASA